MGTLTKTEWLAAGRTFFTYLGTGWRKKLLSGLLTLLTFGLIGQILYTNRETFLTFDWQIRPGWAAGFIFFFALSFIFSPWCWHVLVKRFANYDNPRQNIKIWWYASLAKRLPGPVWYMGSRVLLYDQLGVSKKQISALSALELALVMISGFILALITSPFWVIFTNPTSGHTPILYLLVLASFSTILLHPNLLNWLWQKFNKEPLPQKLQWQDIIFWIALYGVAWLWGGFALFCLINALYPLPLVQAITILGIWALSNSLSMAGSLTLTSMGVRELSMVLLLAQLMPHPIALMMGILCRLFWLMGEFFCAFLSLKL
jgi:hypothetical protein